MESLIDLPMLVADYLEEKYPNATIKVCNQLRNFHPKTENDVYTSPWNKEGAAVIGEIDDKNNYHPVSGKKTVNACNPAFFDSIESDLKLNDNFKAIRIDRRYTSTFSGNLASGIIGTFHLGSGALASGAINGFLGTRSIASGSLGVFTVGSGSVMQGSLRGFNASGAKI